MIKCKVKIIMKPQGLTSNLIQESQVAYLISQIAQTCSQVRIMKPYGLKQYVRYTGLQQHMYLGHHMPCSLVAWISTTHVALWLESDTCKSLHLQCRYMIQLPTVHTCSFYIMKQCMQVQQRARWTAVAFFQHEHAAGTFGLISI